MIAARDAEFHPPVPGNVVWAETNSFSFYVPERNLCGLIYVLARQRLGAIAAKTQTGFLCVRRANLRLQD
jgi:hypothetical protein